MQLLAQGVQGGGCFGIFRPLIKNPVGIQQDIQTFVQEQLNQLRSCAFLRFIGSGTIATQGGIADLLQFCQEGFGARQVRLGILPNLAKALGQEMTGIANQAYNVAIGPFVLCPGFLDEAFQGRDHRGNRCDTGGVCAAFEGMKRARQVIGISNARFVACGIEEIPQGLQVGFGFTFENVQQHWVDDGVVFLFRCCQIWLGFSVRRS